MTRCPIFIPCPACWQERFRRVVSAVAVIALWLLRYEYRMLVVQQADNLRDTERLAKFLLRSE